jgi:hypothetical protein
LCIALGSWRVSEGAEATAPLTLILLDNRYYKAGASKPEKRGIVDPILRYTVITTSPVTRNQENIRISRREDEKERKTYTPVFEAVERVFEINPGDHYTIAASIRGQRDFLKGDWLLQARYQGRMAQLHMKLGEEHYSQGFFGPMLKESVYSDLEFVEFSVTSESVPYKDARSTSDKMTSKNADIIREVQELLSRLKYDPGPIDGVMGSRTRSAIKDFERDHGYPETGQISEELLQSLKSTVTQP